MSLRITLGDKLYVEGLSRDTRKVIREKLTLINPQWRSAVRFSGVPMHLIRNIPKHINMYDYNNGVLTVPRAFNLSYYLSKKEARQYNKIKIKDRRVFAPYTTPIPEPRLRPNMQQQRVLDLFDEATKNKDPRMAFGNFLNVLEVSSGKTVLSALLARKLKQRALVIVHTTLIRDAWIDDLCRLFGPSYKKEIGIIQGGKALVGPHFTIAMAQTWTRRSHMWEQWWKMFGMLIFDECHICPANTFRTIADMSPAAYRFGITGTDRRKDGMHKMMYHIFGRAFYRMKTQGTETETSLPIKDVRVIDTYCDVPKEKRVIKFMHGGQEFEREVLAEVDTHTDYTRVMNLLTTNDERNLRIAGYAARCLMRPNNSVLIVTHRREHAYELKKAMSLVWKGRVALLLGTESKHRRVREFWVKSIKERRTRCVIATIQLVKTGMSLRPLNRLFITTTIGGVSDLEQVIGRIRRKDELKEDAKIYHFVDQNIGMCVRHFNKRALPFYRDKLRVKRFRYFYVG